MQLVRNILNTNDDIGSLLIRVVLGAAFIAHGAQKLFGWLGGYGLEATGQWLASEGFTPGYLMAVLAGSAEFFGGIALVLGLMVRPAAFLTAFTMLVAMTTHWSSGFFLSQGGYEYVLVLMTASLALVFQGAGKFSVDRILNKKFFA